MRASHTFFDQCSVQAKQVPANVLSAYRTRAKRWFLRNDERGPGGVHAFMPSLLAFKQISGPAKIILRVECNIDDFLCFTHE